MKKPEKVEQANRNIALAATNKAENDLNFHEQGLRDNADAMSAFSIHLYQIKAKGLWGIPGCTSFKHYCETRVMPLLKIPLSLTRLYQLAEFEEVRAELPPAISTIVETESQARELAKAPKAKRVKIVKDVAKKGKVTAKAIAAEVKKQAPVEAEFELMDKTGYPIPKRIRAAWEHAEAEADAILKFLNPAKKLMEEKIQSDPAWVELSNNENAKIRALVSEAKRVLPHAVCPSCDAHGRNCKHCKQRGYISKYLWDACPKDVKKERK